MRRALLLAALALSNAASAGQADAIRSCYGKGLPAPATAAETDIFVAIDQTTPLDGTLRQLVADNIKPFLGANNGFAVLTFSAYMQGHYTELLTSGRLDPALAKEQRDDVSKTVLATFDQCTRRQPQQAAQLVGNALRLAYGGTSGDIAKSDVLASLKAISGMVRQSKARSKIVLIVSDMLENSSVADFYGPRAESVRRIDAAKELRAVTENDLLADFGGARVYVIGAGLLPGDQKLSKSYRDPKTMQALGSFWRSYLEQSHAQLVEFGQPALLSAVR